MELVKVREGQNGQVVSARELHKFLEVESNFSTWCKRMFEYGFEENVDYILSKIGTNKISKSNPIDYALTLDTAKEISMIQRSEKGKQARKYFIKCEKKLKNPYKLPQTYSEALAELAKTTEEQERLNKELKDKDQQLTEAAPKVVFADSVTGSSNSILVRKFAKDLCNDGFDIGQNRLFKWFRDNCFLNRDNEPYQNYISQGLFEVITRTIGSGTETFTAKTTKITGKGQTYFAKKLINAKLFRFTKEEADDEERLMNDKKYYNENKNLLGEDI